MLFNFSRPKSGLGFSLAFIGLLWFGTLSLRALDRYVVEPGTIADGNGGVYSDWSIAATQIQWAIDASTNANDTIWVSNGTYVLTNQIVVISNIVLRSTNGPDVTIVNGGFVAGATDATTNNRCLILSNSAALVSGFTFSNGACTNAGGAGVWLGKGVLSNCTVRDCISFSLAASVYGGGIWLQLGTVTACQVTGNILTNGAVYGGGAGIFGGIPNIINQNWEVNNCVISNNRMTGVTSARSGGGIAAGYGGKIRQSLICNNSAGTDGYGGGVYSGYGVLLSSSTVSVNQASLGGGIYLATGMVTNCLFSSNYGPAGQYPGIYCSPNVQGYGAEVHNTTVSGHTNTAFRMAVYEARYQLTNKMINCIIENNNALGLLISGYVTNYSTFIISNCIFRGNKGGGVSLAPKNLILRNTLIANNTNSGTYAGLQLLPGNGTHLVSGCTIVSNYGTNYGAGIRFEATDATYTVSSCIIASNGVGGTNDVYDLRAPTNYNALQYSCVGLNPGFTGASVIVASPQFADFAGGDFHLSGNSPCINAGSNETWMTNAFDLDKRARIRYGVVDMGAYEVIQAGTVYGFQ